MNLFDYAWISNVTFWGAAGIIQCLLVFVIIFWALSKFINFLMPTTDKKFVGEDFKVKTLPSHIRELDIDINYETKQVTTTVTYAYAYQKYAQLVEVVGFKDNSELGVITSTQQTSLFIKVLEKLSHD